MTQKEINKYKKDRTRELIKEYLGSKFYFLENFLDGKGYEEYVKENLNKITRKKVYGVEKIDKEYRGISSPYILYQDVLNKCEECIEYVNNDLKNDEFLNSFNTNQTLSSSNNKQQ